MHCVSKLQKPEMRGLNGGARNEEERAKVFWTNSCDTYLHFPFLVSFCAWLTDSSSPAVKRDGEQTSRKRSEQKQILATRSMLYYREEKGVKKLY